MTIQRVARHVPLTQHQVTFVDVGEYAGVTAAGPWFAHRDRSGTWYARRNVKLPDGQSVTQGLHKLPVPGLADG